MPENASSRSVPFTSVRALTPLGSHQGKPPIALRKAVVLVGARRNAHIHLLSDTVSKAHALILNGAEGCFIRDLASRSGVYINDVAVSEARLNHGDVLRVGSFTFRFSDRPDRPGGDGESGQKPEPAAPAVLEIPDEPTLPVAQRVLLIGRRHTCDIARLDPDVSTAHAVIFELDGKRYVRDLGSRTGTFVNEELVHQRELADGDVVGIGGTEIRYLLSSTAAVESLPPTLAAADEDAEADRVTPAEAQALLELDGPAPTQQDEQALERESDEDEARPQPYPQPIPLAEEHVSAAGLDLDLEPLERPTADAAEPAAPSDVPAEEAELALEVGEAPQAFQRPPAQPPALELPADVESEPEQADTDLELQLELPADETPEEDVESEPERAEADLELQPPPFELETPELELPELEALKSEPAADEAPIPPLELEEIEHLALDEAEEQPREQLSAEAAVEEAETAVAEEPAGRIEPLDLEEAAPVQEPAGVPRSAPPAEAPVEEAAPPQEPTPPRAEAQAETTSLNLTAAADVTAPSESDLLSAEPPPAPAPAAEQPRPVPPGAWGIDRDGYLGGTPLPLFDRNQGVGRAPAGAIREADVFSELPTTIDESMFADAAGERGKLDPLAGMFIGPAPDDSGEITRAVPPAQRATQGPERPPAVAPVPVQPVKKRRRWFGLPGLLIAMLVCISGATMAIYAFVPVRYTFEARVQFIASPELTEYQWQQFRARQEQMLMRPEFRHSARQALRQRHGQMGPGFLSDDPASVASYLEGVQGISWNGHTAALRYSGASRVEDRARVEAVVAAWHDANRPLVDGARTRQQALEQSRGEHQAARQRYEHSQQERDKVKQRADQHLALILRQPELREQVERLEQVWQAAVRALAQVQREHQQFLSTASASAMGQVLLSEAADDEPPATTPERERGGVQSPAVAAMQEALEEAVAAEEQARQAYEAAQRELERVQEQILLPDLRRASAELPEFDAELAERLRELNQAQLAEDDARRAVGQSIEPRQPDLRSDVHSFPAVDPRPTYAAASMGGIVLIFSLLMLGAAIFRSDVEEQPVPGTEATRD